jgi:predicted membrane protein
MRMENERGSRRELAGLIIILIGFALLMNTMNIFPFGSIVERFWLPVMFIAIGAFQLSKAHGTDGLAAGIFFVMFGLIYFLSKLFVWDVSFGKMIGPAILMWIGLSLLLKGQRPKRVSAGSLPGDATVDDGSYIEASSFLGGFNRKCSSKQFSGGELTAFMGGGKIDFRDADLQSGVATMEVFVMMGGIELQIPRDWTVEQRVTPILGGCDDKTHPEPGSTKRLVIEGSTIMGGVMLTN